MNLIFSRVLRGKIPLKAQSADTFPKKVSALANVRALVSPAQLIILCLSLRQQRAKCAASEDGLDRFQS
jgi:hypothetical protein